MGNINQCINEFADIHKDGQELLDKFISLINEFKGIQWGPHVTDDVKEKTEGNLSRLEVVGGELQQNLNETWNEYQNIVTGVKDRTIKKKNANMELIVISQKIFSHLEYLSFNGLTEVMVAIATKEQSHTAK